MTYEEKLIAAYDLWEEYRKEVPGDLTQKSDVEFLLFLGRKLKEIRK